MQVDLFTSLFVHLFIYAPHPFSVLTIHHSSAPKLIQAISTDVWGTLLNAAMLIRLRDKSQNPFVRMAVRAVFRSRRFSSLLAIAGASTGVRMMFVACTLN